MNPAFNVLRPHEGKVAADDYDPAAARARLDHRQTPSGQHNLDASARYYRPDDALVTAINTALAVEAPLLLTGEPGTGKTQVAYYLKRYFGIPLFAYQVRSTSTVEDMKYDFDAVGYLHYAQHGEPAGTRKTRQDFLTENALWQAFEYGKSCVLLIDEIDKAPRDFPNDLLQELDQYQFKHPFEDRQIPPTLPQQRPMVIITSNVERRLPDAFLRRCVFHHIALDPTLLDQAVAARLHLLQLDDTVLQRAKECFWAIRSHDLIQKKPATAEFLVWLLILNAQGSTAADLDMHDLRRLPGLATLIKDKDDLERLDAYR